MITDQPYYFGILDSNNNLIETFPDLRRRFPRQGFSWPETNEEMAATNHNIVRIYRAEIPVCDWRQYQYLNDTGIKCIDGIWQDTYEVKTYTNQHAINKINSHIANEKDPSVKIIMSSDVPHLKTE
jgi:hypothetical protein